MDVYHQRLAEFKKKLQEKHLDGALIVPGPNFRYFTSYTVESFERFMGLFIPAAGDPLLLLPQLEEERGRNQSIFKRITSYKDADDMREVISSTCSKVNLKTGQLGVEGQLPFATVKLLQRATTDLQLENIDPILRKLRLTKDEQEIEKLRRSSKILEKALTTVFEDIRPGMTELEIARSVTHIIEDQGADVAFRLVQSGSNSAVPHHTYGDRKVKENELVLLDIGCKYKGYVTDITRPIVVGEESERMREIYRTVLEAQKKAISSVKPRVEAREIDEKARTYIRKDGYGERFIHRTGHGLGLEVHEPPYIKEGNTQQLEPGMVFTIEPGIYLSGKFGIRIEDDIVVTQDGFENLTSLGKELR